MDSLTKAQQYPYTNYPTTGSSGAATASTATASHGAALVYKAPSKKDLSSSFSQGQTRKATAVAVRRVSSASVGGAGGRAGAPDVGTVGNGGGSSNDITDNGKVSMRTRFWNLLKI